MGKGYFIFWLHVVLLFFECILLSIIAVMLNVTFQYLCFNFYLLYLTKKNSYLVLLAVIYIWAYLGFYSFLFRC